MRSLSTTMPEVHAAFSNGQFSIQMGKKTSGGYIGFSANFAATQRWVLNDTRRAAYRKLMREHLSIFTDKAYVHTELTPGRIKADARDLNKLADLLDEVFRNPLENQCRVHELSYGDCRHN